MIYRLTLLLTLFIATTVGAAPYTNIQLRRDTPTNWANYNPVLKAGEPGCEMTGSPSRCTAQKIGDGVTNWTNLPYITSPWVDDRAVTALADADALAVAGGKRLVITRVWTTVPNTLSAKSVTILPGGQLGGSGSTLITGDFEGCDGCFGTSRAVTGMSMARPEYWGTDGAAIQKAVNAASNVLFDRTRTYSKTVTVTVPANRTLEGNGATVTTTADNVNGFTVTGSNVTFKGLTIQGPQYASLSTSRGISAAGTNSAGYIENFKVLDCNITAWGIYGVYMQFVDGFDFAGTTVKNIFYAGIMGLSVQNGSIPASVTVKNITGSISSTSYGISLTREDHDSLVTHPRSKNITVSAKVDNVPTWNGIGTHGGENILVSNAIVTRCRVGIEAVAASNSTHVEVFAPLNFNVVNSVVNSGVTDGSAQSGIRIVGAGAIGSPVELATGSITGGAVVGHGQENNTNDGGVLIYLTRNVAVTGVSVIEPGRNGIIPYHDNYGMSITGNSITDAWTNAGAIAVAIHASSDYNTGIISGNTISRGTKTATHVLDYAVRAGTGINNRLHLGQNYSEATAYANDNSTGRVAMLGGPFTATETWDPSSVNSGNTTTTTVAIGTATVGCPAIAAFSTALPAGVYLRSEVTAQGVITVTLVNGSGSVQDLDSGTLTVRIFK